MTRMDRCADLLVQYARCRNGSTCWKLRQMTSNARMTPCMILSNHQFFLRQKTVHEMDFFDVTTYGQVEIVPLRHVFFAETVKTLEFDPVVHTISAPMTETVLVKENDAPAPTVAQQAYAVPDPVEEYDDGSVVNDVHVPQVQVVEKTIEIP